MPTRDDYLQLIGRLNQLLAELSAQVAAQRPADAETRDQVVSFIEQTAERQASETGAMPPLPPDGGEAARLGLGADASRRMGEVPAPVGVAAYDEQVASERLLSVGDLYYCYCHDRLGVWRAVYALQEQFRAGQIRLTDGPGAFALYRFDLKRVLRYGHAQRMSAYRRVFGYTNAPPPPGSRPNDAFHGLFAGFCGEVAQLFRDKRVAEVVRGPADALSAGFGSIAAVRRAGLDLRSNLKRAAYGDVSVLAVELLQLLKAAFDILGAEDVMQQFGTDNAWDTLEEVLLRVRGEQVSASLRSRMAVAGREVLHWLAHPHILIADRPDFETRLQRIAEYAEEWLTSARSLGLAHGRPASERGARALAGNVVPFRRAGASP